MRLPGTPHLYFLVYRGFAKWDEGWSAMQFRVTKCVAVVETLKEARKAGHDLNLPCY